MSKYTYTFKSATQEIVSSGCNLISAAEKAGILITIIRPLGTHELQSTKFEDRVRTIYGILKGTMGSTRFEVSQKYS